jgi:hypothetical protein
MSAFPQHVTELFLQFEVLIAYYARCPEQSDLKKVLVLNVTKIKVYVLLD